MTLVLIILAVLALLVATVAVGVGRARRRDTSRAAQLMWLAKLRSPSGTPFFPTDDSALELAELLDDVDQRRRREQGAI